MRDNTKPKTKPIILIFFYIFYTATQTIIVGLALYLDNEDEKLIFMTFFDILWYHHFLSIITIRAYLLYIFNQKARWNKLERLGKNLAPVS